MTEEPQPLTLSNMYEVLVTDSWGCFSAKNTGEMKDRSCLVLHEGLRIKGILRSSVTLPCSYDVNYYGLLPMCWGRRMCTLTRCGQQLLVTDGKTISYNLKSKYELSGDIEQGNLSLTIHDLNLGDEGWYCCRLEIHGLFNDRKEHIALTVIPDRLFKCPSDYKTPHSHERCQLDSRFQRTPSDVAFCNFMNLTTTFNGEMCDKFEAGFPLQRIIEFSQSLLSNLTLWKSIEKAERQRAVSHFLEVIESGVIAAALGLRNDSKIKLSSAILDVEISFVKRGNNMTGSDIITLQAKGNSMNVHSKTIIGDDDSALLAFISYSDVESILDPVLMEGESEDSRKLLRSQFYSKVITVTKGNNRTHKLNGTVNITFHGKEEGIAGSRKVCAHWKSRAESPYWATAGCQQKDLNETHTECICNHLSSFAVLLALYEITVELKVPLSLNHTQNAEGEIVPTPRVLWIVWEQQLAEGGRSTRLSDERSST
ncbi:adhesion G protein-coupled receptor E2-like [Heptranchias perlo]|uniref:adhesion G protein-coupled receptor E2-like n=1 Tax=Heptranchias perlo TaxID=212740 RepID=UPI00355AB5D9